MMNQISFYAWQPVNKKKASLKNYFKGKWNLERVEKTPSLMEAKFLEIKLGDR